MTRAEMLAWRRQLLIAECSVQRAELALQVQPIVYTIASVNIGMRILGRLTKHPGWIASLALGLVAIRPHRLSSFIRLGTASLRFWRHAVPLLQSAAPTTLQSAPATSLTLTSQNEVPQARR